MTPENLAKIEALLKEFFAKTTFDIDFELHEEGEDSVLVSVRTLDASFLIGRNGATMLEMQKLLGQMISKQLDRRIYVYLDINNYREDRLQYLKDMAQDLADKAVALRKEELLPLISSYERRIVHTELAKRNDVITESQGEGENRRLVIKPV
ncbi:MAG: hypothetical protein M1127_01020 [Patescibacteria group bacterium]|nr:hypothetical protein [Patescibacteria group bacterium]